MWKLHKNISILLYVRAESCCNNSEVKVSMPGVRLCCRGVECRSSGRNARAALELSHPRTHFSVVSQQKCSPEAVTSTAKKKHSRIA